MIPPQVTHDYHPQATPLVPIQSPHASCADARGLHRNELGCLENAAGQKAAIGGNCDTSRGRECSAVESGVRTVATGNSSPNAGFRSLTRANLTY